MRYDNDPGFWGRDGEGKQQCLRCWRWKFPVIHSCKGVPQPGTSAPPAEAFKEQQSNG